MPRSARLKTDPRTGPCYFGFHYDFHAGRGDTRIGTACSPKQLMPMLELSGAEFIQADCKGHPGYTSWFSQTPTASVPPGLRKDALKQWREATRRLGLPLHCHYSGIWDRAAMDAHPDWNATWPGKDKPESYDGKACPRGPYLQQLMIPQMLELIDRYDVDGFWVDGDLWAVVPCYCNACTAAYRKATGQSPPRDTADPDWPRWWSFTLDRFLQYVRTYVQAVHDHAPHVRVCSNWLHTFRNPVPVDTGVDWISGDNTCVWGLDQSRCEARYLANLDMPWDIMVWGFFRTNITYKPQHPPTFKPVDMLQQEAAVILSLGGGVQIYEHPECRDGRLTPWRQDRLGQVARFVKKRRSICGRARTIPQIAVLNSEIHLRRTASGECLLRESDLEGPIGATLSLLDNNYSLDILNEANLLRRLDDFPIVVAAERNAMSDEMVAALTQYVRDGGRLLLSGADACDRFSGAFLGVSKGKVVEDQRYLLPAAGCRVPVWSKTWRLLKASAAEAIGRLGKTSFTDQDLLRYPVATLNAVGRGKVLYAPFDLFADFDRNRYPLTRKLIGKLMRKLAGRRPIEVDAPTCIDAAFRRKDGKTIIQLVNRASGLPHSKNDGAVDEIPPVGPIRIRLRTAQEPTRVKLAFEKAALTWNRKGRTVTIDIEQVHIHAAVVIEGIEMQRG